MRRLLPILLLALCCQVALAKGEASLCLNAVTLPIANHSAAVLTATLKQAFKTVMIRLSGNEFVMTVPEVASVVSGRLQRFVLRYRYHRRHDPITRHPEDVLSVVFDQQGIVSLLQKAGQPVWLGTRPKILMWVSIEAPEGGEALTLSDALTTHPVEQALRVVAHERGVTLLFPVMDLNDTSVALTDSASLSQVDKATLAAVKERYGIHSVLISHLQRQISGQWTATWFFDFHHQVFRWELSGGDMVTLVRKGFNRAVTIVANQLAIVNTQALRSTVLLRVVGIENLADHAALLKKLRALRSVVAVSVDDMAADSLVLRVTLVGGERHLVSVLQGQQWIHAIPVEPGEGWGDVDLYYRFLPSGRRTLDVFPRVNTAFPRVDQVGRSRLPAADKAE